MLEAHTPHPSNRTRTCSGPGSGTGASRTSNVIGATRTAARMVLAAVVRDSSGSAVMTADPEESRTTAARTMRAAVLVAPMTFEVREAPVPEPGPEQVRVRLEGCGVCASNIPPWEGRPWFNYPMEPGGLGHEGWGSLDA